VTVAEVVAQAGLTLVGRCEGGEIQAYEVRLSDGRPAILKWYEDPTARPRLDWMLGTVARLHAMGCPLPRYEPLVEVPGAFVVLQEKVPGALSDDVDGALIERVLSVIDHQSGLADVADDGSWGQFIASELSRPGPARSYLPALDADPAWFPAHDAVHMDLHHRNVLQVDGRLSAVIDWETCRPGDRWYDVVLFAICLSVARTPPGAAEEVWRLIEASVAPEVAAAYSTVLGLRLATWALESETPWTPEFWAAAAGRGLG
jgi:Ser/Thr protein kinase RdoA (MazF antagonist)